MSDRGSAVGGVFAAGGEDGADAHGRLVVVVLGEELHTALQRLVVEVLLDAVGQVDRLGVGGDEQPVVGRLFVIGVHVTKVSFDVQMGERVAVIPTCCATPVTVLNVSMKVSSSFALSAMAYTDPFFHRYHVLSLTRAINSISYVAVGS